MESVEIPIDAGLWSGGTRELYFAVNLLNGESMELPGQRLYFDGRSKHIANLVPGLVIVRHSVFCGRDSGLTFYLHPSNATAMLPAPTRELNAAERVVLYVSSAYIAKVRREYAARAGIDATAYDNAIASLQASGLMSKSKGLTVSGRNASRGLERV